MTDDAPIRRYAKGDAKRREILATALTVISERGYRNSSLQEIADSVGLTKAGVLHYFDSREGLLVEVLRERDAADIASFTDDDDSVERLESAAQHNQDVPGLVELFSRLVVESESEEHPGHDYIGDRYAGLQAGLAEDLRARQRAGTLRPDVDPEIFARVLMAVSDGIQLQWLHDRSIDMRATYAAVVSTLTTAAHTPD